MGNLFPDDAEYPSHQPLPSPADALMSKELVAAALIVAGSYDLCPRNQDKIEDPPHREMPPISNFSEPLAVVSSTASPNPFFGRASDGNDVAIQNGYLRRAALTRLAASTSFSNVLALF